VGSGVCVSVGCKVAVNVGSDIGVALGVSVKTTGVTVTVATSLATSVTAISIVAVGEGGESTVMSGVGVARNADTCEKIPIS